jgi:predicted phosphate transport protein (TIGR00153 family)
MRRRGLYHRVGNIPDHRSLAVGFRLTPKDDSFFELFATLARLLVDGARELTNLVDVEHSEREAVASRIRDIEHSADEATHAIMLKVNSSFITPFDREDIYRLASKLDDCMDLMEAAADLIVLYRIGDLPDGISAQVQVLARMSELTADAMPRLRAMGDLSEYWSEISRLENEADQAYRRLVAEVFNNGKDAIMVLKLKEVIDELEAAADAFETAAHTVESIAVKES